MLKTKKIVSFETINKTLAKHKQVRARGHDLNILLRGNKRAADIAIHYGFRPIESPSISRDDLSKTKTLLDLTPYKEEELKDHECLIRGEEKIALIRYYLETGMISWPQPIMYYYEGPLMREGTRRRLTNRQYYHLDILGTTKSIAEAALIKTAIEILKEEGYSDLIVLINSVGDKDSIIRFSKELSLYYRKHLEVLQASCRQQFKKDPYEHLYCTHEKCREICAGIPDPVSFLTEQSRHHFTEVLEYLETLGISYELKKDLIHNKKVHSQSIFEIRTGEDRKLLARGIRYNEVGKKMGMKRDVGNVGITISLPESTGSKRIYLKKIVSPKVYFIQLGFDAKLKSLQVIDLLRSEKIPLAQSLAKDKMVGQLQIAENLKVPYSIIMGQKEARENSVIVRDMNSHSQETVPISELARYLKKLK